VRRQITCWSKASVTHYVSASISCEIAKSSNGAWIFWAGYEPLRTLRILVDYVAYQRQRTCGAGTHFDLAAACII
jgi:hypothetical protein